MAISRSIVEDRKVPGTSMGPAGRGSITFGMDRPQTLESLRRNILPPRGTPMPMPTPMPNPRFPMPMPMPLPRPMPGPRGPMPLPSPPPGSVPPGMGPFRPQPFPDQMPRGRQGIMEAAAVDPSDFRTIQKLLDAGLDPNDYIQAASMAYDDDDYGPFIPPSVIEMDRFGTGYGPQDEYLFDREKGFENRIFGKDPDYKEMSGIMSALPQETQMAELNDRQRRALGTRVNRFAYDEGISSPQDMLKMISPLDKPSFFGFGGNEANEQDIIDFYKNNTSMVG